MLREVEQDASLPPVEVALCRIQYIAREGFIHFGKEILELDVRNEDDRVQLPPERPYVVSAWVLAREILNQSENQTNKIHVRFQNWSSL